MPGDCFLSCIFFLHVRSFEVQLFYYSSAMESLNESGCSHSATYLLETHAPCFPSAPQILFYQTLLRLQDPPCVLRSLPSASHLSSQRLTAYHQRVHRAGYGQPSSRNGHRTMQCSKLATPSISVSMLFTAKFDVNFAGFEALCPNRASCLSSGRSSGFTARARICLVFAAPLCVPYMAEASSCTPDSLSFA